MSKTLKDILPEVYEPVPEDEKRFKEKHGFDPNTGRWPMFKNQYSEKVYDTLFRGLVPKAIDRSADRHGYNPGEDEKHYESYQDNRSE